MFHYLSGVKRSALPHPRAPMDFRPFRTRPIFALAAAMAMASAVLVLAVDLYANGGALRLAEVPMGDYRVSVFTNPTPVRPSTLEVSVLVVRPGREGVVEGVDVRVRAAAVEAASGAREDRATRERAEDPRYYLARLDLDSHGPWDIEVHVRGEHGEGIAAFQVTARERGWLGHPLTVTILALLPLAALAYWAFRTPEEREGLS